ncbi:MAG: WXG100 family type VII secretion target, partial [Micromonosporaceae bacterium]
MILPVVSGAVNLSGVVAWLARAYDSTLAEYQRRVTGDPGALRQVAGGYRAHADRVAAIAEELLSRSRSSGADWQGAAYQAFGGAVTRVGGRVDVTEHRLRRQATAVETAASALDQASRTTGEVRAHFQSRA